MTTTFSKAPLIEIIVELRWSGTGGNQMPMMIFGGGSEAFMSRVAENASKLGFRRSERLLPAGFPIPPGQVVYRMRPDADSSGDLMASALLQVGPGVFTANAVPPYSSWDEFRPTVELGIKTLLESRDEAEKGSPFEMVSLRYIDVFSDEYLGGKSPQQFIEDILGFKVALPDSVIAARKVAGTPKSHLAVEVPVSEELAMTLTIGEAVSAGGRLAVRLEWNVRAVSAIGADLGKLMSTLDSARKVLHDAFVGMTKPLHALMGPK